MKDILDREIKIGDIVAHGTRAGNGGAISIKIVADIRSKENRWASGEHEEVKVINYRHVKREYDSEIHEWHDVEPYFEKGGVGWSAGGTFVIINESVPVEVKEFLKSLV